MDDRAVSSTFAFVFAGTLFIAAVGSVMLATRDIGDQAGGPEQDARLLQQQALAIRDLALGSPGFAAFDDGEHADWTDAERNGVSPADVLKRFGLQDADGGGLDFAKLNNLRSAPYAADQDGYVNYEEARASLGLDTQGFDFHIRAYPSLHTVREMLATGIRDHNLRVTYIGDAATGAEQAVEASGETPVVYAPTCALSSLDNRNLVLEADVTNNGQAETQFHLTFDVTFADQVFSDTQRASWVAAGDTVTFRLDVPAAHGGCHEIQEVGLTLIDPTASLVEASWLAAYSDVGQTEATGWFTVDPDRESYTSGDEITIGFAGDLQAQHGNTDGETLTLQVVAHDGTDITPSIANPITVPKSNKPWVFESFDASELGLGDHTVLLYRANGEVVQDQIIVAATEPGPYVPSGASSTPTTDHDYSSAAVTEIGFLEQLVDRFCPYVWDSQSETPMVATWAPATWSGRCNGAFPAHSSQKGGLGHYGDVFPDDKKLLGDELHRRLAPGGVASTAIVNTLVIGSNVDHNTMTSNAVKGAVRDWVVEAGGHLIVLGSEKQVVNWLNPIFQTKLDSSSNGLSAPDADHPVLTVADDLDWDQYDERGRAWELKSAHGTADSFTKVVHDNSADKNAVLAISDSGAYGNGTVILTSWLPYDVFNDGSSTEGMLLLNNLLMQGYRDLFLDYGPSIPPGVTTVPADGRAQVYHPQLERYVALTLRVYVFPS